MLLLHVCFHSVNLLLDGSDDYAFEKRLGISCISGYYMYDRVSPCFYTMFPNVDTSGQNLIFVFD